jgi:hypothetical protein
MNWILEKYFKLLAVKPTALLDFKMVTLEQHFRPENGAFISFRINRWCRKIWPLVSPRKIGC